MKIKTLFYSLILISITGCTCVDGNIESYPDLFDNRSSSLFYELIDENADVIYRGEAIIDESGFFEFKFPSRYSNSSTLQLSGSKNLPASILGSSTIFLNRKQKKYNLGKLYSYDYMDLNIEEINYEDNLRLYINWSSNIPNVDKYKISILRFKPNDYSFKLVFEQYIEHNHYDLTKLLNDNSFSKESLYVSLSAVRFLSEDEVVVGESKAYIIP